jgi:hypothetical protein
MDRTAKVIDRQHPLYRMICTVGPLVEGSDVHYVTVVEEPWHSGYARDEQLLFVEETPAERAQQVDHEDVQVLYSDAVRSIYMFINGDRPSSDQILRLGMFFGEVSRLFKMDQTERVVQLDQIARRLHTSLDDVIALFVEPAERKYGQYSTLDEAFDALAESQEMLHLPLTMGIAQIIEEKRKEK